MAVDPQTSEAISILTRLALAEADPVRLESIQKDLQSWQWEASRQDPWFFLRNLAITKNENPDADSAPYQPFPNKQYLKLMLDHWNRVMAKPENKIGAVLKSRQMMASWFYEAMFLYICLTSSAKRLCWQSKKAEDSNEALKRIIGIWERLPDAIKEQHPMEEKFLHLHFPRSNCDIHGIAQGPDQVRQFTWSHAVIDEAGFQEFAEQAYFALLPALGKHGVCFLVSTAAPSFFETIFTPHVMESHKTEMRGFESWSNHNGVEAIYLNWRADPDKTEEWADKAAIKYGGRESAWWRGEMEGDFGAQRGGLVFPQFGMETHTIPEMKEIPQEWPKYRVIDPGYGESACAVGWFTVNPHDRMLILYRELYVHGKTVKEIAPRIKALSGKEEYEYTIIDPSAFAQTLAASGRSIADLFVENGIVVNPAYRDATKKHQIQNFAALLVVSEYGQPSFKATRNCENFIAEILKYRWREVPDGSPRPETPVKVDDHMIDTCVPGWSMIRCRDGDKRMDLVRVGDEVLTRDGWKRVLCHAETSENAELWMVRHEGGRLIATGNHPVWVEGFGFKRLDQLTESDTLLGCESQNTWIGSSSTEPGIGGMPVGRTTAHHKKESYEEQTSFIETSGSTTTVQSQMACASITGMEMRLTTPSKTSNSWEGRITPPITVSRGLTSGTLRPSKTLTGFAIRLQRGTEAKKGSNGTPRTQSEHGLRLSQLSVSALFAERPRQLVIAERSSGVLRSAHRERVGRPASMMNPAYASDAKPNTDATDTRASDFATRPVRVLSAPVKLDMTDRVFNIEVEGTPEFFADGILVHNCLYMAASLNLKSVSERVIGRDPLRPWYEGTDRRRIKADSARLREEFYAAGTEYEP